MLAGFWTLVYDISRTLISLDPYDVTARHFLLPLGFFAVLTVLGFLLAVDFTRPVFANAAVSRPNALECTRRSAVFGAMLTTVYGALYQL